MLRYVALLLIASISWYLLDICYSIGSVPAIRMASIPPTTVAVVQLRTAPSPEAERSLDKLPFSSALTTVKSLPGVLDVSWSLQREARDKLAIMVNWADDASLTALRDRASSLLTNASFASSAASPVLFHARLDGRQDPPGSTDIRSAPVTEMVLHYYASPLAEGMRERVSSQAAGFIGRLYAELPSILSFSTGWQRNDDEPTAIDPGLVPGGKAIMFVKFHGWPSVEEHMKAGNTKAFRDQIPNLRLGAVTSDMKHVSFRKV